MNEEQYQTAWKDLEERLSFVFSFFQVFHEQSKEDREKSEPLARSMRREAQQIHAAFINLNIRRQHSKK